MNSVVLIGRTTREVELRYTTSQTAVARFSLAVERPVKDGEKKADFPNIIVLESRQKTVRNTLLRVEK